MLLSSAKIQLVAVLAVISSAAVASELDPRASTLTLPDIFTNATAQVTSLRQQLQRAIVFNTTLNTGPDYVQSVLSQVNAVIGNTAAQVNQIGKLPLDQISGGLSESELQYVSTDFLTASLPLLLLWNLHLTAVGVSLIAPQSVTEKYPELQESIDTIQASICPINWFCFFFPTLCWPWFPWVFYVSATFKSLSATIAP
ncbi:hypothetical protein M407DRAFT_9236 [Tulasnella calospora MUT 4182]|uniref:Uncharacterized protein n=1 Tax=Tulasnella calospora MUT 4182 TaxID=1051891 RepID=A0A0C3QF51_9AGAM|nr:hypothetical protein M407DRAFT_9236 [Tulasnella calospora MUT 4182]